MDSNFQPGFSHLPIFQHQTRDDAQKAKIPWKIEEIKMRRAQFGDPITYPVFTLMLELLKEMEDNKPTMDRPDGQAMRDAVENSLNYLAESARMMEKVGNNDEAAQARLKLKTKMDDSSPKGRWGVARAKAEQAMVLILEKGFICEENYDLITRLFEEADSSFRELVKSTDDPAYCKYEMTVFQHECAVAHLRHCETVKERDFFLEVTGKFAQLANYFLELLKNGEAPLKKKVGEKFIRYYAARSLCYLAVVISRYCAKVDAKKEAFQVVASEDTGSPNHLVSFGTQDANAIYEEAIKINPKDSQLYVRYASSLNADEDHNKAFHHMVKASRLEEEQDICFCFTRYTRAHVFISLLSSREPEDLGPLFQQESYSRSKMMDQLNDDFKHLCDTDYNQCDLRTHMGSFYLIKAGWKPGWHPGQNTNPEGLKKAMDKFEEALTYPGGDLTKTYFWFGHAFRIRGEHEKAIESFKIDIELQPPQSVHARVLTCLMQILTESKYSVGEIAVWLMEGTSRFHPDALLKTFQVLCEKKKLQFPQKLAEVVAYFVKRKNVSAITQLAPFLRKVGVKCGDSDIAEWNQDGLEEEKLLEFSREKTRSVKVLKPKNESKTYDFVMSFSFRDEDWVEHVLLSRLERIYSLKGCIAPRDINVRDTSRLVEGMVKVMKESKKLMFVVSRNFVSNVWEKFQQLPLLPLLEDMKTNGNVIVVLHDMNLEQVPDSLKDVPRFDLSDLKMRNERIKALSEMVYTRNLEVAGGGRADGAEKKQKGGHQWKGTKTEGKGKAAKQK